MNKELKGYINSQIKPKYKTFDKAHNVSHFLFVTNNCKKYAKLLKEKGFDVDEDIAFVVGAYHDVGMVNGRENHALSSGKIVREDKILARFFSKEIVEIIAQAVEDHSSHLQIEPRNIYGKIVADADRNNTKYLVFARPIKFGLKMGKNRTKQEQLEEVFDFVNKKFGRNGYVKYWLDIPETISEKQEVWALLDNKELCMQYISGIFDEITKGKYKEKQ